MRALLQCWAARPLIHPARDCNDGAPPAAAALVRRHPVVPLPRARPGVRGPVADRPAPRRAGAPRPAARHLRLHDPREPPLGRRLQLQLHPRPAGARRGPLRLARVRDRACRPRRARHPPDPLRGPRRGAQPPPPRHARGGAAAGGDGRDARRMRASCCAASTRPSATSSAAGRAAARPRTAARTTTRSTSPTTTGTGRSG